MAIQSKKFTLEGKTYRIKHHPATEGCAIIEKYHGAFRAFSLTQQTTRIDTRSVYPLLPFKGFDVDGRFLSVLMFLDKLAAPDSDYGAFEQPELMPDRLTLKEVLAGKTLADRVEPSPLPTPAPYLINYSATTQQDMKLDIEDALHEFFKYITLDGEELDYNSLSFIEIHGLLSQVFAYNFLNIWTQPRWNLPENYNAGGVQAPRSLDNMAEHYSQSNVIYTILKSELNLATMADLCLHLNTADAYDLNESAKRDYYERVEMQKESERQAKNNQSG